MGDVPDQGVRAGDRIRFGKVEASFELDVASAAQPLPQLAEAETRPADLSARPADFANASPFQTRKTKSDRTRKAVFAAVALACVALLVSLVALALMKAPEF